MRIIDKNRDFYDYFQEYDSDIVFDRRGSRIITNEELNFWQLYNRYNNFENKYLLLQIGYTNWLILAKPTNIDKDTYGYFIVNDFSLELVEMWKDYNKSVDFKFGNIKTFYTLEYLTSKKFHKKALIDDIKLGNFEYKNNLAEKSPIILNKTKLPSILNAQDVYLAIEEWLSHKKDDIVHDFMTDKEKIVSHGFDTKSSFRGK